jgi:hypothetical protein
MKVLTDQRFRKHFTEWIGQEPTLFVFGAGVSVQGFIDRVPP